MANDHALIHQGSMAMRGWGNLMVEATGVTPEGRITPNCLGLWKDEQIAPLKRIVDYVHANQGKIGIQLAHSGRKGSTLPMWVYYGAMLQGYEGGETVTEEAGGWPENVMSASAISFNEDTFPQPREATKEDIEEVKEAFRAAIRRAKVCGFDYIELHGAHGYLMYQFQSPVTNQRTDDYGGSFENRIRFPMEIVKIAREEWDGPLLYRTSATEWLESALGPEKAHPGQKEEYAWWGMEQTLAFAAKLRDAGVDLLDVSSGGNDLRQKIVVKPGYQVEMAAEIRAKVPGLLIGAVGLITDAQQAEDIVKAGQADVALFAREVLRNVDFPLQAAHELGAAAVPANQYSSGWTRMLRPKGDAETMAALAKAPGAANAKEYIATSTVAEDRRP